MGGYLEPHKYALLWASVIYNRESGPTMGEGVKRTIKMGGERDQMPLEKHVVEENLGREKHS